MSKLGPEPHLRLHRLPLAGVVTNSPKPQRGPYRITADGFHQARKRVGRPDVVHLGQDIVASEWTPVVAPGYCSVYRVGWDFYGGWTAQLSFKSSNWKALLYFAHMHKEAVVKVGQKLSPGDLIGLVGRTGRSDVPGTNHATPPHLHITHTEWPRAASPGTPGMKVDSYTILTEHVVQQGHSTSFFPHEEEEGYLTRLQAQVVAAYGIALQFDTSYGRPPARSKHVAVLDINTERSIA